MAEPERVPSFLDALNRYDWHEKAACYDEPDPDLFFPESGSATMVWSPRVLLPLLICSECPVRRQCLEESYASWDFTRGEHERESPWAEKHRAKGSPETQTAASNGKPWALGIWGGTTEDEREAARVAGLSADDAIDVLDRTMHERLEVRVQAYLERRASSTSKRSGMRRCRERLVPILTARGWKVPDETR